VLKRVFSFFAPPLAGERPATRTGGEFRKRFESAISLIRRLSRGRREKLLAAFASLVAAIILADLALPPPINRAGNVSAIVTDRNGYWLHAFATKEGRWRFSADLDEIDPAFVRELIAVEDKRFYSHWGVDPFAVARAGRSALLSGRIVSGASTITMQTARLLGAAQAQSRLKAR